ncbi:MAG: galactarate dehydratase [Synergistaceae bacterium]|nr:galactarate dehydratase [Synergistaceae bacterium]
MRTYVRLTERDNVAVVTRDTVEGTEILPGVTLLQDVPQAHKFALTDIPKDGPIIRYGVTLGYALAPIPKGAWINEHMLRLPEPASLDDMPWGTNIKKDLPEAPVKTFMGYRNPAGNSLCGPEGGYAGTRNILGIQTTVQCVQGVLDVAVERIRRELLPKYPNVDDVVPVNHAYGCGVAINAPEAVIPIRALQNLCHHPNFGGQLMVVSLGCEKLTVEKLIGPEENTPENVVVLQDCKGFEAMMDAILGMAEKKLKVLNERRREELPLSDLLIGMQCGGSDAFSGVSANPSAGYAADMLVSAGATVLFSEVTEVRDGVHLIAERCVSQEVRDKLAGEMRWYDRYLAEGEVDRSANPTPGNKKGGLSNIVEKAMGSIAKSGTSPIVEVLSPAERPSKRGLIYAATPASDIVCGPCQLASGIGLQVFMTGRGTPYGLAAAPVIKVCSRNEMKAQWPDLIDVSAGDVVTGERTIAEVGTELFNKIIDVASGRVQPFAERYRLHNYLCIFNPAPIT